MNQVLVVDDEASMRAALEASFRRDGWGVATAAGVGEALAKFRQTAYPLVVTDMRMPDGDGLSVMRSVQSLAPETAVIFLTAFGNVPEAVQAIQGGACDYLVKPVPFDQLRETAQRVLRRRQERAASGTLVSLVGSSPAMRNLIERARHVARTDADILVEAESGTGKELLARLLHAASPRHARPFVAVNCAAMPDTMLESELFGYVKGAFTGAATAKPGKFELADRGTLLLDEIGELPLSLQPKLLRVLQEREVDRLGATRPVRVDVRVIATTNRALPALIAEGKFRADLYYRLNVVPLAIPPLRERPEDIPELVAHFLRKYVRASGLDSAFSSPELLARLQAHDWPGNVRELENFVRRVLALSSGPVIEAGLFDAPLGIPVLSRRSGLAAGISMREMEKQLLHLTLEATGGNRTHAAAMLGVSLRTVRNKIREHGLPRRGEA